MKIHAVFFIVLSMQSLYVLSVTHYICRIYRSYHILFKGVTLFYHIPHNDGLQMSLAIY